MVQQCPNPWSTWVQLFLAQALSIWYFQTFCVPSQGIVLSYLMVNGLATESVDIQVYHHGWHHYDGHSCVAEGDNQFHRHTITVRILCSWGKDDIWWFTWQRFKRFSVISFSSQTTFKGIWCYQFSAGFTVLSSTGSYWSIVICTFLIINVLHNDVKGLKFLPNVPVVINLVVMMSIYFIRCFGQDLFKGNCEISTGAFFAR